MKLDSLQKLYVHELKDLYSAENQLLEALPKMCEAASHDDLKQLFMGTYQFADSVFPRIAAGGTVVR